ncbi:hypothetical protein [Marinactinospora rubrisoli]|uniref:Uncharacterized protein n=1 Tax=Marinactinospora rubrisoli TaxID=2715399 RepID=A0ABW2KPK0_9ACTN
MAITWTEDPCPAPSRRAARLGSGFGPYIGDQEAQPGSGRGPRGHQKDDARAEVSGTRPLLPQRKRGHRYWQPVPAGRE